MSEANLHKEEDDKKRKRSEQSSISDLDTSRNNDVKETVNVKKGKKKKSEPSEPDIDESEKDKLTKLGKQVYDLNLKLDRFISKYDLSMKEINKQYAEAKDKDKQSITESIKAVINDMKDDITASLCKQIEVLEFKLFEKEEENQKLKDEVKGLKTDVLKQEQENNNLKTKLQKLSDDQKRHQNECEQYSRRNNIRLVGIKDPDEHETAETTTKIVTDFLKSKMGISVSSTDIDIAHRLPGREKDTHKDRDIIVKFQSRITKEKILRNRKQLKGTGVYVNEDLTKLNQLVLMCVKRKMSDEVAQAWSSNGNIFFRNKLDRVKSVPYEKYQDWIDLPWPTRSTKN